MATDNLFTLHNHAVQVRTIMDSEVSSVGTVRLNSLKKANEENVDKDLMQLLDAEHKDWHLCRVLQTDKKAEHSFLAPASSVMPNSGYILCDGRITLILDYNYSNGMPSISLVEKTEQDKKIRH